MEDKITQYILEELRNYKLNKAILEIIDNDDLIGCQAQKLSGMPHSITNKFHSVTEQQALSDVLANIKKDVRRVDIWLSILTDEEKFVIEQMYIHNRTYYMIGNAWRIFYTRLYWQKRKKAGLQKIRNIITKIYMLKVEA